MASMTVHANFHGNTVADTVDDKAQLTGLFKCQAVFFS